MSGIPAVLTRTLAIPVVTGVGLLAVAPPAAAAVDRFHRFEVVATANYTVPDECTDGSTAETLVTVRGGHEEETENGVRTLDSDFLTVLIRGFDCDGNVISERASGPADFTFTNNLSRAAVTGSVTSDDGRSVTVAMEWLGRGQLETTSNTTNFPGFHGKFTGKTRDAIADGTVVVDGETLVDGSTTNAEIESLEDKNVSRS